MYQVPHADFAAARVRFRGHYNRIYGCIALHYPATPQAFDMTVSLTFETCLHQHALTRIACLLLHAHPVTLGHFSMPLHAQGLRHCGPADPAGAWAPVQLCARSQTAAAPAQAACNAYAQQRMLRYPYNLVCLMWRALQPACSQQHLLVGTHWRGADCTHHALPFCSHSSLHRFKPVLLPHPSHNVLVLTRCCNPAITP